MDSLLEIKSVSKRFDGVKALSRFSASIEPNKVTGLVGPNGAGKSTLFDIITRIVNPDEGDVLLDGLSLLGQEPHQLRGLGVARTFQITRLFSSLTVRENLLLATRKGDNGLFRAIMQRANGLSTQTEDLRSSDEVIERLALSSVLDQMTEELSHGWAKLVSLACTLATKPRLLLLDEPIAGVNHLIVERIFQILTERVQKKELTIVVIEHNLTALSTFCDKLIVMHQGEKVSEGPPDFIRLDDSVLRVYTGI